MKTQDAEMKIDSAITQLGKNMSINGDFSAVPSSHTWL